MVCNSFLIVFCGSHLNYSDFLNEDYFFLLVIFLERGLAVLPRLASNSWEQVHVTVSGKDIFNILY